VTWHRLQSLPSTPPKISTTPVSASPTLSQSHAEMAEEVESRIHSSMTHEEMAHRIGASRETGTRLLSNLKKKQLIRQDGRMLVIRNRNALEALAV
jgi:CRP-like cAMP-binding protein